MPFGEDDGDSLEMGLKMPSKVDVNLIRGLLWGFLFMLSKEDSAGGMWVSGVLLLEENFVGNRI